MIVSPGFAPGPTESLISRNAICVAPKVNERENTDDGIKKQILSGLFTNEIQEVTQPRETTKVLEEAGRTRYSRLTHPRCGELL